MNEEQIRQIVREEVQKNYMSGSPDIPPHSHNGTDGLQISADDVLFGTKSGGLIIASIKNETYKVETVVPAQRISFYGFARDGIWPYTLTGALSVGATSATTTLAWNFASGTYRVIFSDGESRLGTFTNGSGNFSWTGGLQAAVTTAVTIFTTAFLKASITGGAQMGNCFNYNGITPNNISDIPAQGDKVLINQSSSFMFIDTTNLSRTTVGTTNAALARAGDAGNNLFGQVEVIAWSNTAITFRASVASQSAIFGSILIE